MAIGEATPTILALRTDAHARRLIVRMSAKEDIALGWQVGGDAALQTILARLAARKIAVEEVAGEEAALRGVERLWRFLGPKRQAFELFTEPEVAPPGKTLVSAFVTGERGLGHVAITTRRPADMINKLRGGLKRLRRSRPLGLAIAARRCWKTLRSSPPAP